VCAIVTSEKEQGRGALYTTEKPGLQEHFEGRASFGLRCGLIAALEKREQVRVDLVLVSRAHSVRQPRIDFECSPLNQLGREQGRCSDGHDLVVVAVEDEGSVSKLSSGPEIANCR
jgi:hypothetical protein